MWMAVYLGCERQDNSRRMKMEKEECEVEVNLFELVNMIAVSSHGQEKFLYWKMWCDDTWWMFAVVATATAAAAD